MIDWSIQKAREAYNIAHWSGGYFDINGKGHLVCRFDGHADHPGIDLYDLSKEIKAAGLALPVLVRFSDILRHRVETLCGAFDRAMQTDGYRGRYTAVYPIKVNQQKSVVEKILARDDGRVGLEAGSKPELLAVLALSRQDGGVVVCNGYKDREYIRLALIGLALGHRVFIVVEKPSELELVIQESINLGIMPLIGLRMRLASIGAGKWQNTGGEKSKFGLSAAQVQECVARLHAANLLPTLQMLHFHMGSQIANIHHIQLGMREAARYYAELRATGAEIKVLNVGGGLGVDYEGTRSRSFCSMNYSVEEYAHNIVHAISEICAEKKIPHPDIVTESGRAMTAHHAVLITNVVGTESAPGADSVPKAESDEPAIIHDLWQTLATLSERSVVEAYHDAAYRLTEAQGMFSHGVLTLSQRARAEQIYFAICWKVRELLTPASRTHREILDELNEKLADKYFCNFSLFQSMPDHWAIDQIFPVVPLHRLNEPPTRRGVMQDITCDSDGSIDLYVDGEGIDSTLPLHPLRENEPYLLGIFLVGAYQEILGDMHNLFGDTDSIHVELKPDGSHQLSQAQQGDTVDSVLRYVNFNADDLLASYRAKIESASALSEKNRNSFLAELSEGLKGYTYLED
ncbi:MAG: biosynthetic arginine decarboxylase [Gammaproteobacteria bacterium]|nr:biosynthetic arginine decarboxylase [Gammaproteobacteria bacterium]MDH3407175.1 biosynthetic arginine decarboxylase [Gammaproteobacteria bacterium]